MRSKGWWRPALALAAGLAVALCLTSGGWAQEAGQGEQGQGQGGNPNQAVVNWLNTLNQGDVTNARMMLDKTTSDKVKSYAKMIETDHQKAEDELKEVASKAGLTLGTNSDLEETIEAVHNRLNGLSASEADADYVRAVATGHALVIRTLQHYQDQVTDPGVKTYLASELAMLEKHEQQAHVLAAAIPLGPSATPASEQPH